MNAYHLWINLKDGRQDAEFARAIDAYLGHLRRGGKIHAWRLERRKLGFGPSDLGEFHVLIEVESLAQLDQAFFAIVEHEPGIDALHARVYSLVKDFRAALYRDWPDPPRATAAAERGEPAR